MESVQPPGFVVCAAHSCWRPAAAVAAAAAAPAGGSERCFVLAGAGPPCVFPKLRGAALSDEADSCVCPSSPQLHGAPVRSF